MADFELPDTVGAQDVPVELYDGRVEGEPFEDFQERRRKNQGIVDEYLEGVYVDRMVPSTRILRRLAQGKRTIDSLNAEERLQIHGILGVSPPRLTLFVAIHNAESIDFVGDPITNFKLGTYNDYNWI